MILHRLCFYIKLYLLYMAATKARLWNKAPVLRLLIPFVAGILLQWQAQFSLVTLLFAGSIFLNLFGIYHFFPLAKKFLFTTANGVIVSFLFAVLGGLLVWMNDTRHDPEWVTNIYQTQHILQIKLEEPLVEKAASYKALATVQYVHFGKTSQSATGKIILYFKKDSSALSLGYGSILLVTKPLQEISNSNNPGSFNYKQYSLFQGITHQLYLTEKDFTVLPYKEQTTYKKILFKSRSSIIQILKTYIKGDKEQGLAEALLIGFKDDLDKNLVQSYTNTGVVHVIAISGLHLGIIYLMSLFVTKPLKYKQTKWLRLVLILLGLWAFSLLAGAQPSVLRSAVMFTAIAFSSVINRKTSIYNTLGLSALALLIYNPYWLWDVGFQLSYSAVLSIIIFFRPIYNWIYFPNKVIDFFWKVAAGSLAAQILTLPISIYHFHQFPFLFLIANLFAVPLSSLILIGEIILCLFSFIPQIANVLGIMLSWLITLMNGSVARLDTLTFAVWNGLSISLLQAVLLYVIIAAAAYWLLEKKPKALRLALFASLLFFSIRTLSFINANNQQKLIVYNVPKHPAIDLISGRRYSFMGDSELAQNDFLRNFHIQPSRIMHRIQQHQALFDIKSFSFSGKNILVIDTTMTLQTLQKNGTIDILVLSKNPKVYISNLVQSFTIKQIIIDGSVPQWKAKLWQKDCDSLHIACHDVSKKGAFVKNL